MADARERLEDARKALRSMMRDDPGGTWDGEVFLAIEALAGTAPNVRCGLCDQVAAGMAQTVRLAEHSPRCKAATVKPRLDAGNELGQAAYEAWGHEASEHVGVMPAFGTLPNGIQNARTAAAERVWFVFEERYGARMTAERVAELRALVADEGHWATCTEKECAECSRIYNFGERREAAMARALTEALDAIEGAL